MTGTDLQPSISNDDQYITADAVQFHNCLEDNFFTQHVKFPTRNDAILDLIITDKPGMVNDIKDLGPFPGSDHNAILWKVETATKQEVTQKRVEAIRQGLYAVDWHNFLDNLSVENSWAAFKNKLEVLEQQYIPMKKVAGTRKKPIWMTYKARKAVSRRHIFTGNIKIL